MGLTQLVFYDKNDKAAERCLLQIHRLKNDGLSTNPNLASYIYNRLVLQPSEVIFVYHMTVRVAQ